FAKMFKDMDAKLPEITQFVVDASNFIVAYGLYLLVGLIVAVVAFRRYAATEGGRRFLTGLGLTLPLVGELMVQSAMYRFASNLGLLLKSGVPILEALDVLCGMFRTQPAYCDALTRARGR